MPKIDETRQLTPFAEALQDWMFHTHRIPWSRPKLAAEAGLPHSTITGWFTRGTLPAPDAFWAIVRVTGWTPEKLMELTGYTELPTKATSESEWIRQYVDEATDLSDMEKEKFRRLITRAMAAYINKPRLPARRKKSGAPKSPVSSASSATSAETNARSGSRTSAAAKEHAGAAQ